SVAQSQTPSLWDHNGSTVSLVAKGTARIFLYETPRAGLPEGVRPGTVLFDGRRDGNFYDGTAYVFSSRCEPKGYHVRGPVSADDRQVILQGRVPVRDSNCQVVGYRDDRLEFIYSGDRQQAQRNSGRGTSSGLIRTNPEAQYDLLRRIYTS